MSLQVYLACAMTGRDRKELNKEARHVVRIFNRQGIKVHHPVIEECIPNRTGQLNNTMKTLIQKWREDKDAIRKSFVLVDTCADMKSEGREHEVGLMRYGLWKPVIRVSPRHSAGYKSIAQLEDDVIVASSEEAVAYIQECWGTWYKRFKWKICIFNRCLPRFVFEQVRSLFQ